MTRNKTIMCIAFFVIVFVMLISSPWASSIYANSTFWAPINDVPADRTHSNVQPVTAPQRLIVELTSPPLAAAYLNNVQAAGANGKLDVDATAAQRYVAQLQAEQAAFVTTMQTALTEATVSTYVNELGGTEEATYQVVFNGMSIDPGHTNQEDAYAILSRLPGVKAVYREYSYHTQLYTSTHLINAPLAWNSTQIGGIENAGAGIKIASMDGGVHHEAPMMDGTGYSYPPGFGPNGKGLISNNNGKIIASRVYFRSWDPPAAGDENPWPGTNGTSHGMHTASTAAGNVVNATYADFDVGTISGVAPNAYVMSYRVFYASINDVQQFFTTEGIAALEDVVKDGADVLNNSWGGGPGSTGGEFDALDTALRNVVKAGIFVSMSMGNSGPGLGTGDHPSTDYINVAASSTSGTLAFGKLNVTAPQPVPANIRYIPFSIGDFGPSFFSLTTYTEYDFVSASEVDTDNAQGCNAFAPNALDGLAVIIRRGPENCLFSDKVKNAQDAGAEFVVIYNNEGEELINMTCGSFCATGQITIRSVFIRQSHGEALVEWSNTHGSNAKLQPDTFGVQIGQTADLIADFSSRGPAVGNGLKPDIAAPGFNILAQGYTVGASGEDRHLGYGQVSGTSMAAPHVAGAAALLKQVHPDWSPAEIKSALMSTAHYMDIYKSNGVTPAQPLDMGAGRLDIEAALDPGVLLDPPSLSFGALLTGTQKTLTVQVTNITDAAETYTVSSLAYSDTFTTTYDIPGVTFSPASLSIAPNETETLNVVFSSTQSMGLGDNQGYLLLTGSTHEAHLPVWARVLYAEPLADILLIDNDLSEIGLVDYRPYYTEVLDELPYTYNVIDTSGPDRAVTIPDATTLSAYKAIIYFTGDNTLPPRQFTLSTGLTEQDTNRLVEYANGGGAIIAMGQDLAASIGADVTDQSPSLFLYDTVFGSNWLRDSVTNSSNAARMPPTRMIQSHTKAPARFTNVQLDLTKVRAYSAPGSNPIILSGSNEVPPVVTSTQGTAAIYYDLDHGLLTYEVSVGIAGTDPVTITAAHIHTGTAGVNGPVLYDIYSNVVTGTTHVTDTFTFSGSVVLTETNEVTQLLADNLYINVHTTDNPGGEVRGQIQLTAVTNQPFIDEIDNRNHDGSQDPTGVDIRQSIPLLSYPDSNNIADGIVAMIHRDQPSLEIPGTNYLGRSVYTAFGLEGIHNSTVGALTRQEFMELLLDWVWSEPAKVIVSNTTPANENGLTQLSAKLSDERTIDSVRWNMGDATGNGFSTRATCYHQYAVCQSYTVQAEVTDLNGNVSIGEQVIEIVNCPAQDVSLPSGSIGLCIEQRLFLPLVYVSN